MTSSCAAASSAKTTARSTPFAVTARHHMIEQQIRPWEVLDNAVLGAFAHIDRSLFVPEAYRGLAWADLCIPLGHEQKMWTPKLEARLLQALALTRGDRVLEIGTGSGFLTALLAASAGEVISFEIVPEIAKQARLNLQKAGYSQVQVIDGDGWANSEIRAQSAPFDAIVLGDAASEIPPTLSALLAANGRLVAVCGQAPAMHAVLLRCDSQGQYQQQSLFETELPYLQGAAQNAGFVF